jgi:hypothetical protein
MLVTSLSTHESDLQVLYMKMNVDQQIRAAAEALLTSSASSPQLAPHLRECMSDLYYTYILRFQILLLPLV